MDVARLNMSHGTHEQHRRAYDWCARPRTRPGHGVGIFADLQGPKIRLGEFAEGPAVLEKGQAWTITTRDVPGDATICSTTYKGLPGDVSEGDPILIDDGRIRLAVTDVDGEDVITEVVVAGKVSNHKGINLPGVAVSRARAVGEGRRGPALRAQPQRRLRRALVRPLAPPTSTTSAR